MHEARLEPPLQPSGGVGALDRVRAELVPLHRILHGRRLANRFHVQHKGVVVIHAGVETRVKTPQKDYMQRCRMVTTIQRTTRTVITNPASAPQIRA